MHEVLVNRLGGLSLPRKSVVRLTDCSDMTLDVYRGRKKTNQQQYRIDSGVPSFRRHVPAALISLYYQRTAWQCGQDYWPGREKSAYIFANSAC